MCPAYDLDKLKIESKNKSEPIAYASVNDCILCGLKKPVLEIDSSGWEYSGTALCSSCLRSMANALDARSP